MTVFCSLLSYKGGKPTGHGAQDSPPAPPRTPPHLYPLTRGGRKFSSKPVLWEILEAKLAASQSITDERCSPHIFAGGRLAQARPKARPWTPPFRWTLLGNEARGSSRRQSHRHVGAAGRGVLAGSGPGKPCVLQGLGSGPRISLLFVSPPPPPPPWLILHMCSARASDPQAIKNPSNPVLAEPGAAAPKR